MEKVKFPVSFLYTPGIDIEKIYKITQFDADVSVFDLEDSVPVEQKLFARDLLNKFMQIKHVDFKKAVRINSLQNKFGLEDILYIIDHQINPDIIIMTMVHSEEEVLILKNLHSKNNMTSDIYVTIETPRSLTNINKIASCCDGLILGSADLSAFLEVNITWENMLYARMVMVNAAATYGICAIDTGCYAIDALQELEQEAIKAKQLGFHGKAAIHPKQVQIINQVFYPNQDEIEMAKLIVSQFNSKQNKIINLNGHMIGPPFVRKAQRLLEKYKKS